MYHLHKNARLTARAEENGGGRDRYERRQFFRAIFSLQLGRLQRARLPVQLCRLSAPRPQRVERKEEAGEEDEDEGEDDEVAVRVDLRQDDDEAELEQVHEHVERVLDAVHDAALLFAHALLQQLGDDQVRHPQACNTPHT